MPHCAAIGCNFQSKGNKTTDISLHSFPSDNKRRKQWEHKCGRTEFPKDPRLCSRHFSPDDFEAFSRPQVMKELTGGRGYKRRLKPNAVPSIFPHEECKRPRLTSEVRAEKRQRQEMLNAMLLACQHDTAATDGESSSFFEDEPQKSSVSVQCSPVMIDATTQTDVNKSDAAVQYSGPSVDASESVNTEHIYAAVPAEAVHGGEPVNQEVHSQDLFLSGNALSEGSQPQDIQLDSEYNVTLSDPSQSTQDSQTSNDSHEDRLFVVFEEQLKQLLQHCMKCGSLIVTEDLREVENEGSQLTLELTCANGCSYRWQSQPTRSGTLDVGNLLLASSVFFSGIHFAQFERFCKNMNLKTISEDTYTTLRKKYVFPVIEKTWAKEQNAVLSSMKSREQVVLCGDGRCDSPGRCAKHCTYSLMDVESQKIAAFKVIRCTQVSRSDAMEIRGFKDALQSIEENGVKVSTISTDRHPQIVKEMRVGNPEKHHEFDPWHVAKRVLKKLAIEAKKKQCGGLGEWIPSIVNHLWWSAQSCEGDAEVLKEKWVSVIHHITNRHDWPGNRHFHRCAHEPLDELSERTKLWLSPGSEAHKALVRIVKNKRLLKDLDHLTKCIHTTTQEVYQSTYLKYLPKRTHVGYDVMVHGSMLAALDHNNNANGEQAGFQEGKTVGCKIPWSKVHKTFRARPVAVKKDYGYMTTMVADVLSSVTHLKQSMDMTQHRTHTTAPQERLSRSQNIFQKQKCYKHLAYPPAFFSGI